jgi:hypothetical protein
LAEFIANFKNFTHLLAAEELGLKQEINDWHLQELAFWGSLIPRGGAVGKGRASRHRRSA